MPRSAEVLPAKPVLLPCGDNAVLAELPDLAAVLDLFRGLTAAPGPELPAAPAAPAARAARTARPAGVLDVVPAARTVLVTFDPAVVAADRVRQWILNARPVPASDLVTTELVLEVHYDGPDLADVAQTLGLAPADVVRMHTESAWTAAFTGFAPGFAYLVTDHQRLRVPRRDTPRTAVPAGAVGLAGEFSGVYPASSPGGWQLIGRTEAVLWDPRSGPGALITPGTRVRFRRI